ncbi:MAG: electron transport complex protein RnfA [Angelakisella sp.]|jgi:electron transport complex protein RnfA|nr:electron transport complex protein RnfA [Angelakisella sp.]
MKEMLIILFTAILVENYVLMKFLAICSFLGVSKKLDAAVGMSFAVIFVMLMATAATWPIFHYILDPLELGYMQTVIFILVIAALVQLVEMILKKFVPPLYRSLGVFLPLITTNCAILGAVVLNITKAYTFSQSMVNSLGAGLGYLLAMVLFSGVRSRVDTADVPECFKGIPITLVAAAIMSVSFMGFTGMVENLFK